MESDDKLLKCLEIISHEVRHHHDALWEEEKHYSWWVYIVLAGLLFVCFSHYFCNIPVAKIWIVIPGALLGIWLSVTAFNIIRREGEFFYQALKRRASIARYLRVAAHFYTRDKPANKPLGKLLIVYCRMLRILLLSKIDRARLKIVLCSVRKRRSIRTDRRTHRVIARRLLMWERTLPFWRPTIRDYFQVTFIVTTAIFSAFIGFSIYAHLANIPGW